MKPMSSMLRESRENPTKKSEDWLKSSYLKDQLLYGAKYR